MEKPDIFVPVKMYCGLGKINTEIYLKDGEVRDRGFGFTEGVCHGCKRDRKDLVKNDMNEASTTKTSITLVDKARLGGKNEIGVVCSGIPIDPLLEGF